MYKHHVVINGQRFTRSSRTHQYTHAIAVRDTAARLTEQLAVAEKFKWGDRMIESIRTRLEAGVFPWAVPSWAGSYDLAVKAAVGWTNWGRLVSILENGQEVNLPTTGE